MDSDKHPLEFMARREDWARGISLYVRHVDRTLGIAAAEPMIMRTIEDDGCMIPPFARISIQSAQQLMDELWQCGLRPSEGAGSAGSLRATEQHLKDMRIIAFNRLKITE